MDDKMKETLKGIFEKLTDEQKERAKACKTMDELMALAAKEGVELPDDEVDKVAGGIIIPRAAESKSCRGCGKAIPLYSSDYCDECRKERGLLPVTLI